MFIFLESFMRVYTMIKNIDFYIPHQNFTSKYNRNSTNKIRKEIGPLDEARSSNPIQKSYNCEAKIDICLLPGTTSKIFLLERTLILTTGF